MQLGSDICSSHYKYVNFIILELKITNITSVQAKCLWIVLLYLILGL
jgi:hypothetical protein